MRELGNKTCFIELSYKVPEKGIRIGKFFKLAKKEGYTQCYKSFQRDMKRIQLRGLVSIKHECGKGGNTTWIRPPHFNLSPVMKSET